MIQRFKEKSLSELLKQFPVVAIIGPRQCGKTTLAKHVYLKKSYYFDLESPSDLNKFTTPEYFLSALTDKCVIIDEVQRKPDLFALLRSLVDKKKQKGKYLLLGSASPHLVQGVSETLAGRIAYLEVCPFNLVEVFKHKNDVNKHWFRGGFPNAWTAKNELQWHAWMDHFFRTFVELDLNSLFGVQFSASVMYKLWSMLAHFQGGIWNAASFSKGLDISPSTVNRYLDYLEGAFMLRKLPAYFVNAKKRLVKSPKIYIRDSGLLHYLCNIYTQRDLVHNSSVGAAWEGYVLEQIIQLLPSQVKPYYYRTHDGSEMDLVLVKGIKVIACIEIKTTNEPKLSRGFYESLADLHCNAGFVVTPHQDKSFALSKQVTLCGLYDFLATKLPKLVK